MHAAEAWLPRDEAISMASDALRLTVARNAPYYARSPQSAPDPGRPLIEAVRMEDAWYFIPYARSDAAAKPLVVRVNALTKQVVIERAA